MEFNILIITFILIILIIFLIFIICQNIIISNLKKEIISLNKRMDTNIDGIINSIIDNVKYINNKIQKVNDNIIKSKSVVDKDLIWIKTTIHNINELQSKQLDNIAYNVCTIIENINKAKSSYKTKKQSKMNNLSNDELTNVK